MQAEPFRYRPTFGLILTCVVIALCAVGLVTLGLTGDLADLLRGIWPLLFAGTLVTALFWRPRIVVTDNGVTVVNVFRTFDVPWQAIERIDTRYAVTLFTPDMRIAVWAAPSPGIRGATSISRRDVTNLTESSYGPGHTVRPGDAVSSASGQIAYVLRRHWERFRDAQPNGHTLVDAEPARVQVSVHRATIVALLAFAAASLVGAVL